MTPRITSVSLTVMKPTPVIKLFSDLSAKHWNQSEYQPLEVSYAACCSVDLLPRMAAVESLSPNSVPPCMTLAFIAALR